MKLNEHNHTSNLFDTFLSHSFIPMITRPTRITHSTATLIDNIYINISSNNTFQPSIITTKMSDHLPVLSLIGRKQREKKRKPLVITSRKLDDSAITEMKSILCSVDWKLVIKNDINDAYESFNNKLLEIINTVSPEKEKKYHLNV